MRRRHGYILIETVVAMAVLSISILGVHRGISQALTARARTMDFTDARFLMEETINELALQPELKEGEGKGTYPAPHDRFVYSWSIKRIDVPTPEIPGEFPPERRQYIEKLLENVYVGKIEIRIAWQRGGEAFERKAETLISSKQLWQPPRPQGGA